MAADGRGLQDVTINDNFAKVAEALYIAERESRIAIQKRHEIRSRAAQKEKERQEESLRRMAERAREQRAGIRAAGDDDDDDDGGDDVDARRGAGGSSSSRGRGGRARRSGGGGGGGGGGDDDDGDAEGLAEREQIRRERDREIRRQRNIANAAPDKRSRLQRDDERDVTERIALGLGGPASKGVTYDSRLFSQGGGLSSGFGAEDSYSVYDKPMRGTQAQSIYRPTRKKEADGDEEYERIRSTDRFRADKGFSGTDSAAGRASGPVQFEKKADADDLDIGLNSFLNEAKDSSKRRDRDDDRGTKRAK